MNPNIEQVENRIPRVFALEILFFMLFYLEEIVLDCRSLEYIL